MSTRGGSRAHPDPTAPPGPAPGAPTEPPQLTASSPRASRACIWERFCRCAGLPTWFNLAQALPHRPAQMAAGCAALLSPLPAPSAAPGPSTFRSHFPSPARFDHRGSVRPGWEHRTSPAGEFLALGSSFAASPPGARSHLLAHHGLVAATVLRACREINNNNKFCIFFKKGPGSFLSLHTLSRGAIFPFWCCTRDTKGREIRAQTHHDGSSKPQEPLLHPVNWLKNAISKLFLPFLISQPHTAAWGKRQRGWPRWWSWSSAMPRAASATGFWAQGCGVGG